MQSLKLSYRLLAGLLPKSLKQGLWSARTRNDIGIGSLQLLERMRAPTPSFPLHYPGGEAQCASHWKLWSAQPRDLVLMLAAPLNSTQTDALIEVSHIICRARCRIKMQGPLFKKQENSAMKDTELHSLILSSMVSLLTCRGGLNFSI